MSTQSTKPTALIGCSGYVGQTLQKQAPFAELYRSSNAGEMAGRRFSLCMCSAAPAQKWIANREPDADRRNVETLIGNLESISCEVFILASTVDVFASPVGVDEKTAVDEDALHPYGLHRRLLEKFVEETFDRYLIVRLPGLVGPGLRKNVVFDFLNDNNLHAIDSRGQFQFYPMVNLWYDIQVALEHGLSLVHLSAEPVSVAEVARDGFGRTFGQELEGEPARYDMRSIHAGLFGGRGSYQYSRRESIQAIRAYAQSEQPLAAD